MNLKETLKNKDERRIFFKKYKVIPVVSAMIFAVIIALVNVDYTEDINKNKEKIVSLNKEYDDKKKEIELKVNEEFGGQKETLNVEIANLNKELTSLKDEKKVVDQKVSDKQNAAAAAKKKEEDERKKGKWAIQSDGYNVWEAYFIPGTYQISVTHKGRGNCILWAGDRSNQKQKLIINKIGAGTYAGTFKISKSGYYTLTFNTDSAFTFEYKGF